jgi:hypothetical protein
LFKVLHRTDIGRAGPTGRCVAIGVSLPLADWIPDDAFNLDHNRRRAERQCAAPRSMDACTDLARLHYAGGRGSP